MILWADLKIGTFNFHIHCTFSKCIFCFGVTYLEFTKPNAKTAIPSISIRLNSSIDFFDHDFQL